MYRPAGHMLWDFWTQDAPDGTVHLFYLAAPRDLDDPELRHRMAWVEHATSRDLRTWSHVGTALEPGPPGAWDDRAIWTGSVLAAAPEPLNALNPAGGGYWMFYTGTCLAEGGRIQRLGLAWSPDLATWEKHPANPLCEADLTWYEDVDASMFNELAWRDPHLVPDPDGDGYLAFVCARVNHGPSITRGCIGLARSRDLVSWTVAPPVSHPGRFAQMEIPQYWATGARHYLLCSAADSWIPPIEGDPIPHASGTFYVVGDTPIGPYRPGGLFHGDDVGTAFGNKILHAPNGRLVTLNWRGYDADEHFLGDLSDPLPVQTDADGKIWA